MKPSHQLLKWSMRSVIALAASKGWNISQMDVYNAFLQGDLYEEVYMELPQGFRKQGETKVCKLLKSLYGIKQASRQWNIKLSETLIAAGYIQSLYDSPRGKLIFDLGLGGAKPVLTPIDLNQKFTSAEFDRHTGVGNDEVLSDANEYQRLVGRLIYLTITRPDIVFAVQALSKFMQEPKKSHCDAAVRVVRYLKHEPGMRIFLGNSSEDNLTCFCDAIGLVVQTHAGLLQVI
uniref:Uncharacterized protein LOC104230854 n=1 Tax=Nicotiana sylvestris TaxID=4096 RepID=A0A1U7WQ45_NICSY|nr:PREDICTED: uncharacterized protein LOC104230854 [Nicotiana sylvestris]